MDGKRIKGTRGDLVHAQRVYTGQGLALENVKPTDSPIYRPPSEFAVRAFRKTFAALRAPRDERERGNRTETAQRRGVPLPKYSHSRTDGRIPHSFHLFLFFTRFLAHGANRRS